MDNSTSNSRSTNCIGQELLLPDLPPGICATITQILADDEDQQRLKAMGVCLGRRVELVKAGDPLILRVLGTRIGVSARLARQVHVSPATANHPCCPTGPVLR